MLRRKRHRGGAIQIEQQEQQQKADTSQEKSQEKSQAKIIAKIKELKVEENKKDYNKSLDERLKKFANLKLLEK